MQAVYFCYFTSSVVLKTMRNDEIHPVSFIGFCKAMKANENNKNNEWCTCEGTNKINTGDECTL